ncbi:hypothetical protein LA080_011989 [Diaporthe eres]|nr:hypothetical protein LA080_011989 [Diaporthe eres]
MGNDQEPDTRKHIAADNVSEDTPGNSTASHPGHLDLGTLLPAHTDLIDPSLLGDSPLDFTGPFMAQDFDYAGISESIEIDLLMSNPNDFLVGITNNAGKLPAVASDLTRTQLPDPKTSPSPGRRSTQGKDRSACREIRVSVDDANNDCAEALANLAKYPAEITASFRFPSKHATRRFVSAFFRHIVPLIPILHEPTFDITTVPSPLLLAVMACGAAYVREQSTAVSLHAAAIQLILEHELIQGVAGLQRAQAALSQLKPYPITIHEEWVRQESINRCLACTIVLGASLGSKERALFVTSPAMEAKFALPSGNTPWQAKESEWTRPSQILYNDDALKEVFAGRRPKQPVSDFGLVALVSAVLYRVCAFEALTSPDLADLYASFGERMGRSVQALDDMVRRRMGEGTWGVPPDPILQSAKSLLKSAFYHLYASIPLAVMKKLLWSPAALGDPQEIATLFSGAASPDLYKALIRAAD